MAASSTRSAVTTTELKKQALIFLGAPTATIIRPSPQLHILDSYTRPIHRSRPLERIRSDENIGVWRSKLDKAFQVIEEK